MGATSCGAQQTRRFYTYDARNPPSPSVQRTDGDISKTWRNQHAEGRPSNPPYTADLKRPHQVSPIAACSGSGTYIKTSAPPAFKMARPDGISTNTRAEKHPDGTRRNSEDLIASRNRSAIPLDAEGRASSEDEDFGTPITDEDMLAALQDFEVGQLQKKSSANLIAALGQPGRRGNGTARAGAQSPPERRIASGVINESAGRSVFDRLAADAAIPQARASRTFARAISGTGLPTVNSKHARNLENTPSPAPAAPIQRPKSFPAIVDYSDPQIWQRQDNPSSASPPPPENYKIEDSDESLVEVKIEKLEDEELLFFDSAENLSEEEFQDPDPPLEPLRYTIPADVLDHAIQSKAYWSYKLYKGPDGKAATRPYCTKLEQVEREALFFMDKPVIGFDMEWKGYNPGAKPSKRLKDQLSVIQIASEDRIAVFHLALHHGEGASQLIGPNLRRIIESDQIVKVGVNIKADMTRLKRCLGVEANGVFELSHVHKLVEHLPDNADLVNRRLVSLAAQVEQHLLLPLEKDLDIRAGDWTKPLKIQQLDYAASDAYAGFMLYHVLDVKRRQIQPPVPRPHFAELDLPLRLAYDLPQASEEPVETSAAAQEEFEDADAAANEDDTSARHLQPSNATSKPPQPPQSRPARTWTSRGSPVAETQLQLSDKWVQDLKKQTKDHPGQRTSPQKLKVYALWHLHQLSVAAICAMSEPLYKQTTVANYIVNAIKKEKLPREKARYEEVLRILGKVGKVGAQ